MIAKLGTVVLDCPDPRALAEFYAAILGGRVDAGDPEWVEVHGDFGPHLSFQLAPDHVPPQWPDPDRPQQFHLDFYVPAYEPAERQVLALGAKLLETDHDDRNWRVYADPAGHPFCLVKK